MDFPLIFNNGKNKHNKLGKGVARTMSMTVSHCPSECTLMNNGCYAQSGPANLWAIRSQSRATDLYEEMVKLPENGKMRHNVSGDFFLDDAPDVDYLNEIKRACKDRPDLQTYGYTHGPERLSQYNPNELPGLTVNASCETFQEVVDNTALGYPCTLVVPESDLPKNDDGQLLPMIKRDDMVLRVCPNLLDDNVKCSDCMLCAKKGAARSRKNSKGEGVPLVVVFPLHGVGKKKAARALDNKKAAVLN